MTNYPEIDYKNRSQKNGAQFWNYYNIYFSAADCIILSNQCMTNLSSAIGGGFVAPVSACMVACDGRLSATRCPTCAIDCWCPAKTNFFGEIGNGLCCCSCCCVMDVKPQACMSNAATDVLQWLTADTENVQRHKENINLNTRS